MEYLTIVLCVIGLNILLSLSVYITLSTGQFSLALVRFIISRSLTRHWAD